MPHLRLRHLAAAIAGAGIVAATAGCVAQSGTQPSSPAGSATEVTGADGDPASEHPAEETAEASEPASLTRTDGEVGVHAPGYDAPGAAVTVIATAAEATGFEIEVDGTPGTCEGETWEHAEGTSQNCWVTLPGEAGRHTITARALLPGNRFAEGTETIESKGPVTSPVAAAAREHILNCGNTSSDVWLTFDDGFTSQAAFDSVLATLAAENVQARFFATGQWARANPRMTAALRSAGHLVENHSATHEELSTIGDAALEEQVAGGPGGSTLLRPGYGAGAFTAHTAQAAARHGQQVCYWTVDPRDWAGPEPDQLIARVLDGDKRTPPARPGGVVLLHMTGKHTPEALPGLIDGLRERGLSLPPRATSPG